MAFVLEMASVSSCLPEVASVGSCVPEVEMRRFCLTKLSRPQTCLRSKDTCGADVYLALLANHHKERGRFPHA